jgi:hypothetical protein
MATKIDRAARTVRQRAPAKRFQIAKLEERIAPKKKGACLEYCGKYHPHDVY